MSSREKILANIRANQPQPQQLPDLEGFRKGATATADAFRQLIESLGGRVFNIKGTQDIKALVQEHYTDVQRVVAASPAFYEGAGDGWQEGDGRQLETVDLAIVPAQLGVAENGAVWVTETELQVRVLPFIAQHLAVVLKRENIVPTMHDAYARIGGPETGFGVFIAGPSKTADIEQSLVHGAHGARSMTVFLM